jgi:hypothetical protein
MKKYKKYIEGSVDLSRIYLMTLPDFLEGLEVKGNFYCSQNYLSSLEGCPTSVGGDFVCQKQVDKEGYSTLNTTEEEIRAVCKVMGKVIL